MTMLDDRQLAWCRAQVGYDPDTNYTRGDALSDQQWRAAGWVPPDWVPTVPKRYPHKLSPDDVREIRALAASGVPRWQIAARYHIKPPYVYDIAARRAWKELV